MTDPSAIDTARIDANWRAITIELDAPTATRLERFLRWAPLPAATARLVAATPALRRSWYLSIIAVVFVGLGATAPGDADSVFSLFVLAPLLPVLGVALAYGSAADPSHEMQLATPVHGLRLVMIRTAVVVSVSMVVVVLLSLLNNTARPQAAAWLLPALAVTATSLAVMTMLAPRRATALVAVAWLAVVLVARIAANDPLAAFRIGGQITAIIATCVAVAIAYRRRDRFDHLELALA